MKWIGQHIYDLVSRFRNNVYVESEEFYVTSDNSRFISSQASDPMVQIRNEANDATGARLRFVKDRGTDGRDDDVCGTIQFYSYDDGTPSVQNYAQIQGTIHDASAAHESGKLTFGVASHDGGVENGLVLTGGSVDTEVDVTIGNGAASVTSIAGVMDITGDVTLADLKVTGGDISGPTDGALRISADTNLLFKIDADNDSTSTFQFLNGAATEIANLDESGNLQIDGSLTTGSVTALSSSGEVQVGEQPNINTLAAVTSMGNANNLVMSYSDIQWYNPVNSGDPTFRIGAGENEHFLLQTVYNSSAQTLNYVLFNTVEASSTANKGLYLFQVDSVSTLTINDDGLNLYANKKLTIDGTDIISDSSGTATLSNIDALDATTEATIEGAIDTLSNLTAASSLATVGTVTTGVWNGTAIASAYMASATDGAKGAVELATTGEADTGTDTARAVTPAGLKSHVDARYSYQYLHFSFKANNIAPDLWRSPNQVGVEYYLWDNNHGSGVTQAASDAPKDVDINTTISVDYLDQTTGFIIPKACKLDGFYGNCRVNGTNPNTLRPVLGLFRAAEPSDSNTADLTATCVGFDSYDTASGNRKNRFMKLETQGLDTSLAQGDILFPACGFDATASDSQGDIWGAFTIVLKTLKKSLPNLLFIITTYPFF